MTVRGRYNESMKNCLLSAAASGAFWLILLFVVSFLAVHTVRLAKIGWNYQKRHVTPPEKSSAEKRGSEPARRDPPAKETSEAPAAEKPPEPVYYIVERKKRRLRETYSPPKEIKFK